MTADVFPTGTDVAARGALAGLLDHLSAADYAFVSMTPATHRLVASRRPMARPGDLRDIFGWGRTFHAEDVDDRVLDLMRTAGVLQSQGQHHRSSVRISTLDDRLHLHSARNDEDDAVFLGPDSYRFVRFIRSALGDDVSLGRALDVGAGAGAGALALSARFPQAKVVASDVNPLALTYLSANAVHARLSVEMVEGSGLEAVHGDFDLIVANPPYVADLAGRTYRDGGGALGSELGLRWVREGLDRLRSRGRFLLYTGAPVVEGRDRVHEQLRQIAVRSQVRLDYEEIDPDVFGGTLRQPAYSAVERIAAIGAVLSR